MPIPLEVWCTEYHPFINTRARELSLSNAAKAAKLACFLARDLARLTGGIGTWELIEAEPMKGADLKNSRALP